MRLCTRVRYGARAMLDLAEHHGENCVSIKEVAERQEMSARYLENLMAPIRSAGLVRTERGNYGGYVLGKSPSEITLGEIVRLLDGNPALVPCIDDATFCHRSPYCVTRVIWYRLEEAVTNLLDGITLADMVQMRNNIPVSMDAGK
ncbi:RrF2 family transcriptional regulator [Chloroflexota bacterium]